MKLNENISKRSDCVLESYDIDIKVMKTGKGLVI